jgi:hypothetical protein
VGRRKRVDHRVYHDGLVRMGMGWSAAIHSASCRCRKRLTVSPVWADTAPSVL